jgi:hypothetical protein
MPYRKGHTRTIKAKGTALGKKTIKVKSTMTKQAKRPKKRK